VEEELPDIATDVSATRCDGLSLVSSALAQRVGRGCAVFVAVSDVRVRGLRGFFRVRGLGFAV